MRSWVQLENKQKYELPKEFQDDDVRYAESLVAYFLDEFTREGDMVFDPFAGFGTTLFVAEALGRRACGLEYEEARVALIRANLKDPAGIVHGDARKLGTYDLPKFNFCMTSPPYMSRRDPENPFTAYREPGEGYAAYLAEMARIYAQVRELMLPGARVVIEASNLKHENGEVTMLAWDIAAAVSEVLHFEGEVVVNWDEYGYGYQHSYCLVFSEPGQQGAAGRK